MNAASPAATDSQIIAFVKSLSSDGVAAVELLGDLPAVETKDGPCVRISNSFPLSDGERHTFFNDAAEIGLLQRFGLNVTCLDGKAWSLNQAVYDKVMAAISELGITSTPPALTPQLDEDGDDVESQIQDAPSEDDAVTDLPTLRQRLSTAKMERAGYRAESLELAAQYRTTVDEIGETVKILTEARRRLTELHKERMRLKGATKTANVNHVLACTDAKQLAKRVANLERASVDAVAQTVLELVTAEATRTGLSVGQILARARAKAPSER